MPTIPQRIASAFTILFGRYGAVTKMARDREQSRQSLYREADQVLDAVDGATAQAQITGEVTLYINPGTIELYDEMPAFCPPDLGGRPRRR